MGINNNTQHREASFRYAGWRVVLACFVMAVFCWGFGFYGQSVYVVSLQQQHHWNLSLVSSASTFYFLFSAVLVIFAGSAITRFGARNIVTFGILSLATATALIGQVDTLWQFYADYALMSIGWATMSVAAITTIVSSWFEEKRGLALTLALSGASAGGIVVTPILVVSIGQAGLQTTAACAAVVTALVLLPVTFVWVRRKDNTAHSEAKTTVLSPKTQTEWTRRRAIRHLDFCTISIATSIALFIQVSFSILEMDILSPRIGEVAAGSAVAITAASALLGRFTVGGIIDRFDPRAVAAISYLSQAVALAGIAWTNNGTALILACAIYGFSIGNVLIFPALTLQREFPASAFPLLISFVTAITQFTYALGPGVIGSLRHITGSYQFPLVLCAVLEASAVLIVLVRSSKKGPYIALKSSNQ